MKNLDFGKLEDGALVYANTPVMVGETLVWTNDPAIYAEAGYLPVEHSEKPEREGYWYERVWQEQDGVIRETWAEHEIPEPEPTDEISDAEALQIITGGAV